MRPRAIPRLTKTHAKFVTLSAGDWRITIRSSGNYNQSPRLKNIDIDDDAVELGFGVVGTEVLALGFRHLVPPVGDAVDEVHRAVSAFRRRAISYELGRRQHLCADALGRRVQAVADANASLLKAGLPFHLSWNDRAKDNPDIVKQLHDYCGID